MAFLGTHTQMAHASVCLLEGFTYLFSASDMCCQCAVAPVAPYACCVGCLLPSVVPFNFVDRSGLLRRPPGDSPSPWVGHVVNVRFSCLPAFFVGHVVNVRFSRRPVCSLRWLPPSICCCAFQLCRSLRTASRPPGDSPSPLAAS